MKINYDKNKKQYEIVPVFTMLEMSESLPVEFATAQKDIPKHLRTKDYKAKFFLYEGTLYLRIIGTTLIYYYEFDPSVRCWHEVSEPYAGANSLDI